uniref:Ribosomal protein L7Ae/L30e/S12e/Gadd45 n=1 Tax=Tanacetum cinerariifolium TaxID=118510 RepID=A0A6L2KSR5_TANCI|nr:ribosomal protein L7Ae/L30e/S12e/Gadd45 [Tanacetum cinerariifolium]
MMKERYLKETKMRKIAKAKENVLNVGIQITSSESGQNYQEATIKEPLLEDHGVIATKMKKKRLKTKNVLWPKLLTRIESAQATPKAYLPYGMFLTRLFRHVMEHYPHIDNGIYDVVERVMRPLALRQARRPRSDCGKARHSFSLTSAHHNRGSTSHQEDDDEDDGAFRASTPSPTTYLNSLKPLNYQQYKIPSPFEQSDVSSSRDKPNCLINNKRFIKKFEVDSSHLERHCEESSARKRNDTKTPSPKHQLSSPSAPNAPSKTPSTKDTSSSSIDYIPKSSTSPTSPPTNGYLNSPTSPPLRVPPPPLTQENISMDITLTLSPITLLDVQFDTPSPSPPIFGHHIP